MPAPDGKLGDPLASREVAVKKMLDAIGRDVSDLTFTPAAYTSAAALPDDPDVHIAWNALVEEVASVVSQFRLFTTIRRKMSPGVGGSYYIPPTIEGGSSTAVLSSLTGTVNFIAAVRILEQPSDLNLVYRGDPAGGVTPRLFDTITQAFGDFSGKGDVVAEVTYWLTWEYIPFPMRKYAWVAATRKFIQRAVGATDYLGFTQQDEQLALARAVQYDLEQSPANFFFGSGSGERQPGAAHEIKDRWPF